MMSEALMARTVQSFFAIRNHIPAHAPANSPCALPRRLPGYDPAMAKDPFKVEFGRRLRATAAEFGYPTAQSIADLCGAERAAVDTWLNGRAMPKWHQAARLCEAWRVTLDWLVLGRGDTLPHATYVRLAAALAAEGPVTVAAPSPAAAPRGRASAARPAALTAAATGRARR